MAKFTPILGNISGKLAGSVFAFNKAGFYIRSFRSPVQPNTINQLTARGIFAASVSIWHSLDDMLKGRWNAFATSAFKAKHPVTGMIYSGYNAFVSLMNQASYLASKMASNPTEVLTPANVTTTPGSFIPSQTPPYGTLSGYITDTAGEPLLIQLTSFEFNANDNVFNSTYRLTGNVGPVVSGPGPSFADPINQIPVGIALYISKPTQQVNQFVPNPEFNLVSIIEPLGVLDDWTTSNELILASDECANFQHNKFNLVDKMTYQVNAYIVSEQGQSMFIGSAKYEHSIT